MVLRRPDVHAFLRCAPTGGRERRGDRTGANTRTACHRSTPRVRVSAGLRGTVDAFDAARDSYHVRLSVKATSSSREAASASVTEQ